jgi:hypothetical protein
VNEAQQRSRTLMNDARTAANEIRTDGLEIVSNLREMGDSLRPNAQRLLRDVQEIHSRMVAEVDQKEAELGLEPAPRTRRSTRSQEGEALDVPEFIPPG